MTEAQWLNCDEPEPMLQFLHGKVSDRKMRLFGVACVRNIWSILTNPQWRALVDLAERYADGEANLQDLTAIANDIYRPFIRRTDWPVEREMVSVLTQLAGAGWAAAWNIVSEVRSHGYRAALADWNHESRRQANLLRHIVGNPFLPLHDRNRWLTSNVIGLAQAIYCEQAYDRFPILADALLDAGCDDADILNHCHSEDPHVRGCWVVDLLLGKQ